MIEIAIASGVQKYMTPESHKAKNVPKALSYAKNIRGFQRL